MKYHYSMNKVCRLVWSQVQNTWVVAAGNSKGRGKSVFKPKLMAVTLALLTPAAFAAPVGGQISAGLGGIAQASTTTMITQQTQNLAINWQSFDIGSNEAVHFSQPSSSSIALNRVLGQNPSQILGSLTANGQVFVVNPNGVLFGRTAQVNVGGLVASTLNISDDDFMAGNNVFSNGGVAGNGSVDNQGALNAANGGYIALISPAVSNTGSISAPQGSVALAAGNAVTLNLNNGSLLGYTIDAGAASALISNGGMIAANGGQVLVTARGADALSAAVVNNIGVIEAHTVQNIGGVIKLMAGITKAGELKFIEDGGQVNVGGTLDASAPDGGDGGFIETSAAAVSVADNALVTTASALGQTGNWLIDPFDFTIAASGGNTSGAALSSSLVTTGVTIQSSSGNAGVNGDVNVNDVVSWSANKLTLNAQRNINVNANMNASGTASLALEYGQGAVAAGNTGNYLLAAGVRIDLPSGQNFTTRLGSDGIAKIFTVINSLGTGGSATGTDLQGINGNLGGNYVLGSNIDASLTSGWNSGAGFAPLGKTTPSQRFTGNFDGLGHTVSNLVVNRPTTNDIGLFGYTDTGSTIRNLGLVNGSIIGKNSGGMVGQNWGAISNSYFTGHVHENFNNGGGLVGLNRGSISKSYSTGNLTCITGTNNVGGLVGNNEGGVISDSYATVHVSGDNNVGGLVGNNIGGAISTSYATGIVVGKTAVGGLVGYNNLGTISNTYATGSVTGGSGSNYVGGLLGYNNGGTLSTSYSIGSVSGTSNLGGLVGFNNGTINYGYWDKQASGRSIGIGGGSIVAVTGLTTAQSMQQSNYSGFDFNGVWRIYNGHTTPLLRSFMKSLTISANNVSKVYDATWVGLTDATSYSDPSAVGSVNLFGLTNPYGATTKNNVGVYDADIWSNQQGYNITVVGGRLTVTPASLAVNVTAASKVYDATTAATLSGASISALGADIVNLGGSGSGVFSDKNVGTGKAVAVSGSYSISGTDAGNYFLIQPTSAIADITRLGLAISGITAANKVYDATRTATLGGTAAIAALGGDAVVLGGSGSGLFADKNVGTGKAVTVSGYTLSGADAGNYALVSPSGLQADITKAQLSFSGLVAADKIYDATAAATIAGFGSMTGLFAGDIVNFDNSAAVATFSDKNAGVGKTVTVSNITISGADAGNYALSGGGSLTTTASIGKRDIAVSGVSAANKVYDATTAATLSGASISALGTDVVNLGGGSGVFSDKNVGTGKAVTVSGYSISGTDAGNYNLIQPVGVTANITKLGLAISGITAANNKVYDATLATTLVGSAAITALGGDAVVLGGSGSGLFADKNVGTGKAVTVSGYTLSGADAGNYALVSPSGLQADITKAQLSFSGLVAADKIYDATTAATIAGFGSMTGLFAGDIVNFDNSAAVATFSDKNVGVGKTVTVSNITISGADAGNYALSGGGGSLTTTASIGKRDIAVSGVSAANKVYDATTAATLSGIASITALGTDVVNVVGSGSGVFSDKNVGTGKAVTVSGYSISGTDAGNYNLIQPVGVTANITKLGLAISGITAANKVYDATRTAMLGGASVNVLGTDTVSLGGGSGLFIDKNVGIGKVVTVSGYTLSGADAGNYALVQPTGITADITPRSLTITALATSATSRVYNGGTAATAINLANNKIIGDVLTAGYGSAAFEDKNVGTGKIVNVGGITLSGTDAGNYTYNTTATTTANISKLNAVLQGVTAENRVYDATAAATIVGAAYINVLGADSVSVVGSGSGTFANKNVGTAKVVTVDFSSYTLSGADAGNYNLIAPASLKADITQRALGLTGTPVAASRVYDGTRTTTISGASLVGVLGADIVNLGGLFANKNVGVDKAVTLALSGTDGGNYSVASVAGLTATITARALDVSGNLVAASRVYDGTLNTTVSGAILVGVVGGDNVTLAGLFADKNVGTGKAVAVKTAGTDGTNYSITLVEGLIADVTPRGLTITAIGDSRTYNAGTTATVKFANNRIYGDILTTGYGSAAFEDKNVGTGKTVNVSGITLGGRDALNYTYNTTATTTANINKLYITLKGVTAANKVYDGTTAATIGGAAYITALGTDSVIVGGSGSGGFRNKNVGTHTVTVDVGGYTLSGADGGNYKLVQPTGVTAIISKRALTLTGTPIAASRGYNGTLTTTVSGAALGGILAGDSVILAGLFANKNVGVAKAVSLTLSGNDGGNYSVTPVAGLTADIMKLVLTVSGTPIAASRVYDGKLATSVSGANLVGLLAEDSVILSGIFADKNVGTGKAVSLTLTGAAGGNYSLTPVAGITAAITPRDLIITARGANRVYNGGTAATVTLYNNRVTGDKLTTSYSAAFEDKNVGFGKTVNVSGITLGGTDAGNYTYNTTATATADISKLNIALKGVTAASKVYDGTTAATIGGAAYVTALGADSVIVQGSGSGTFSDKNVGTTKTVAVDVSGYTLAGTDGGNYNLTKPAGVKANITKRALALTGTPIAASRVYDGTLTTSVSGVTLTGILNGDSLSMAGMFTNRNVGVAKAVSLVLTGTDGRNYSIAPVAGVTANVTALALTVSGTPIAASRVYDGKLATAVSGGILNGVLAGDSVILSGNFADKNVGTGKAVSLALTGAAGGNYILTNQIAGITAAVTPRDLTITAKGFSRVYNGGTAAIVTLYNDRVTGDILTISYSAAFEDKNVGTGKIVNVSGFTLGGRDALNYTPNTTATTTANITKLNIALKGITATNRMYDGTTGAAIGGTAYVTALGTDSVSVEGNILPACWGCQASFSDKNAAKYKLVTVNLGGYTLTGADAGNYNLTQPIGLKANITPRTLTITADNQSMLSGSVLPAFTYTVGGSGLVGGDTYSSVFTGGLTTLASSASTAGNYSITRGTLGTNTNYVISTYVNGVLTIQ